VTELSMESFGPQRLEFLAQTRLTGSESELLDKVVAWCRDNGVQATRSSVIRTCLLSGLRGFERETGLLVQS
jgi:hypothetical protein